mmetsp:Transcript_11324/g.15803  ORF Transcript_11324/g.15803 Transcript_11324/m.15803 type:complete len:551 (-) Transcript_11324:172-1824(-)
MKIKNIGYKDAMVKQIRDGLINTSTILSITLGPRGKNVVLWDKTSKPQVINDGTAIVNKLNHINFLEHTGQNIIKDVIYNINDSVGDGTSTTGLLSGCALSYGLNLITAGYSPNLVCSGIVKGSNLLLNNLFKISWSVNKNRDILNIATNSAGGDILLGKLIVNAYKRVGTGGLISIEASDRKKTSLIIYGGLQIDRGYVTHKFITNFKDSTCEFTDCSILVTDLPISSIKEAAAIMQLSIENNKPLLIISDTIEKKPLTAFIANNHEKRINICAIKIPSFGVYRKSILQDISIATGAEFISKDSTNSLKNIKIESLGTLKRCIIDETSSTLIAKNKYKGQIKSRIKFLENQLSNNNSTYETSNISERIAKLSGGIAVINVGASTELELIDKKLRLEDAKNATFSALTQGVVVGSSVSLIHLSNFIDGFTNLSHQMDEVLGLKLLKKVLMTPNRSIINNANEDGILLGNKIIDFPFEIGYDAEYKCLANLINEGIIDPSLLVYSSMVSICKVSNVLLNAQAAVTQKKSARYIKIPIKLTKPNYINDFLTM